MRLGHINERLVSDLHKYVNGVPALPGSDVLHCCPMCAQAKLHKANCGDTYATEATKCWQDIQIDFGFFVQCSSGRQEKKKPRSKRRKETCKLRLVRLLHDLRVLTRAQCKKLSVSVTPKNGDTTDATAASTDLTMDSGSNYDSTHVPSSAPIVEIIEENDSSIDPPSMPDLRVHHPSSDSDSDENEPSSCTPVHVSPSASQAFAPSLQ